MTLVYPQIRTGADLLTSIIKLSELAPLLKERGAFSAAIVNTRLYGTRSFVKMLKKYGIRPIIGLTVTVQMNDRNVKWYVYAKDVESYERLLKLSSAAASRESETIPLTWLISYSKDCLVLAPVTDESWNELANDESAVAIQLVREQAAHFYLGIARNNGKKHEREQEWEEFAQKKNIEISAMYEALYLYPQDEFAFRVATAIRKRKFVEEVVQEGTFHLLEKEMIQQLFSDRLEWVDATACWMEQAIFELPTYSVEIPSYPLPLNETAPHYLEKLARKGLEEKGLANYPTYEKRLVKELKVIEQLGFSSYFLIVQDYIRYARSQGIAVGPGRGSSASSLVAYCLMITAIDPLKYGLLFERFLNPERSSLPDIDVDFADSRRDEVIEYVANKYGKQQVAQIITFGTLSAKAVARDVARVFQFSTEEMQHIAKTIPNRLGITLQEAQAQSKALRDWVAISPVRSQWLQAALRLEGLPRTASTHAAGVVLRDQPLVERVPVQLGNESLYLTQWAMKDVEEVGLLKMDFLGLQNLTILEQMRKMTHRVKGVTLPSPLPLEDQRTMSIFQTGDTSGIFQFESGGMRQALQQICPTTFQDIYAVNALYRPGPMEMIPVYAARKKGDPFQSIHPKLEPILNETYGVIVYQEQIMQIAVQVAGYSVAQADLLRRAISKKDEQLLKEEARQFIQRAESQGLTTYQAQEIYQLIVKFANYGFPKSHAVAYSVIAFELAYYKAHHPTIFYAVMLRYASGNRNKIMTYLQEMRMKNIALLPPSITKSHYYYSVEPKGVRVGLQAIKGISYPLFKELQEKGIKNVQSLFQLAQVMSANQFSEALVYPLIASGALDEFEQSRSTLQASIPAASRQARFGSGSTNTPIYTLGEEWSVWKQLQKEQEVVGFYISKHPVEIIRTQFPETSTLQDLSFKKNKESVQLVAVLTQMKVIRTKKGEPMAFLTLQDETGEKTGILFPGIYNRVVTDLHEQMSYLVTGSISYRKDEVQVVIEYLDKVEQIE